MSAIRFLGLIGSGVAILALTEWGLYAQRTGDLEGFVALALAQGVVYMLALGFVWRGPASRGGLAVILGVAMTMRIVILAAPPFLSSDVYRYVWDGRVLAAGINPYRYIPTDPHLARLRDNQIFPLINRGNYATTIYPPAAEAIFFTVTRVSATVTAMKAAMVVFEAIAVLLLLRLLAAAGLPRTRIIVYAWHPLPVWEFAGSGHIDAAIVACVALALWSRRSAPLIASYRLGSLSMAKMGPGLRPDDEKASDQWLAGAALAAAVLVKLYPAVLFPALWRREWRMSAAFAAAVALAYVPFLGVGWGVLGFLPGYMAEEGFSAGGAGFYLWSAAKTVLPLGGVADIVYLAAAASLLAGLGLYLGFRRESGDSTFFGGAVLAAAFTLLVSPHYPWYFAWLIVFACLVPMLSLLWLTLASFVLYLVPVGSQFIWNRHRFCVESALYVPFLVLAAIDLWRRRLGVKTPDRRGAG